MNASPRFPFCPAWSTYAEFAWQGTRMMLDAQAVIALRLTKIAMGGAAAEAEAALMVNEKIAALVQSQAIAGKAALRCMQTGRSGGSTRQILNLYQRRVAANRRRLGGS
jgi:hypothetical protein